MENKPTLAATIRPLTENDAALIYTFFTSFSPQTRRFFTPHAIDLPGLTRLMQNIPLDPTVARFCATVIEDRQEVMAGYVFFWDWHTQVPWFGIGATDRFHGMGLGNRMMEFAIDYAKRHSKGGILLTTQKPNFRAQAMYKKFGFEMIGEETHLVEFLMILRFKDEDVKHPKS
jgi:ribosomal protein S18 acetylase RimI-like enzyme